MIGPLRYWLTGIPPQLALTRHPGWKELRRIIIEDHPYCAACGGVTCLEVHHIRSVASHPELELERTNCIVLCMAPGRFCHWREGHRFGWSRTNKHVREDAAASLARTREVQGAVSVRLISLLPEAVTLEKAQRRLAGLEGRQAAELAKRDAMIRQHVHENDRLMFELAAMTARAEEAEGRLRRETVRLFDPDGGGAA